MRQHLLELEAVDAVAHVWVRVRVRIKNGGRALRKIRLWGIETEHAKTEMS
jgi:hypothetical protein